MNLPRREMLGFLALLSLAIISILATLYFVDVFSKPPFLGSMNRLPKNSGTQNASIFGALAEEVMGDDFLENNRNGYFPKEDICHYLGLRKNMRHNAPKLARSSVTCKPHELSTQACALANAWFYIYKPGLLPGIRKCDETAYEDICKFVASNREGHPAVLSCSANVCGASMISYGTIDPSQGIVAWTVMSPFSTDKVREMVSGTRKDGFQFAFLKCSSILQALLLEPTIQLNSTWKPADRININILAIDSVSRPHFYRALPHSVAAMREVVYDASFDATVLDFELVQAIGQHTFENIRALFSGVVRATEKLSNRVEPNLEPLGIDVLYKRYKDWGYQTMFAEDLCWRDHWGIMMNSLLRSYAPSTPEQHRSRWKEFEDTVSKLYIDNYGLTHFSCAVLDKYGKTGPYEDPDKICVNGKFFSHHFLEYLVSIYRAIGEDKKAAPMISYQHLNTGHTGHGTRISNVDTGLASFIREMGRDPNTLTIILSDHGHIRTHYGKTLDGRQELYNPFLFIVVPRNVARRLGRQVMSALVENQHRLLTLLDVHKAVMALHNDTKMSSRDYQEAGLFALLPSNRTCGDLDIAPLAKCRCHVDDMRFADNSKKHKWLAEFGLGNINNAIQEQFIAGHKNGSSDLQKTGFGFCSRLVGKSFRNIMERQTDSVMKVTFDLHVASPPGFPKDEIFQIAVERSVTDDSFLELSAVTRLTMYNKFSSCKDSSVEIKLCVCDRIKNGVTSSDFTKKYSEQIKEPVFGQEPEVTYLHETCLLLIQRSHDRLASSYEIANFCDGKRFKIEVSASYDQVIVSRSLPTTLYISSKTVYFVMAAVRKVLNHSHFHESFTVTVL